jgi:pyruvate dehydrogenase E2 component (dihydrolipoamide acetyltransferase)
VRKLAKDLGVELSVIEGTGPDGRVTEDDVRAAAGGPDEDAERVPVTPARKTIAGNLERQATIPQVTTFRNVDCTSLETWRADLGVSPLPVVVAALCRTVEDHPLLNASWGGDHLRTPAAINVGLAADTERGLVVPVVRNAGAKGIAALAEEIRRLAAAAREGTLSPEELSGATIAVSNTGSYGSEAGTPILSPGTGVTLAFGAIQDRALVVDGVVVARKAATISLTFDHRVLDGAAVGRALGDLVALLESAERLEGLPR